MFTYYYIICSLRPSSKHSVYNFLHITTEQYHCNAPDLDLARLSTRRRRTCVFWKLFLWVLNCDLWLVTDVRQHDNSMSERIPAPKRKGGAERSREKKKQQLFESAKKCKSIIDVFACQSVVTNNKVDYRNKFTLIATHDFWLKHMYFDELWTMVQK